MLTITVPANKFAADASRTCGEPLSDHLVGAQQDRHWHFETKRLGGLEKLWDGGEGVASSLPVKLMEMPHDNPCKRYESIPRRL
jgi:hypothetical protein